MLTYANQRKNDRVDYSQTIKKKNNGEKSASKRSKMCEKTNLGSLETPPPWSLKCQ